LVTHEVHVNGRFLKQPMTGTQRYSFEILKHLTRIEDLKIFIHVPKGTVLPQSLPSELFVFSSLDGVLFDQIHMGLIPSGELVLSMSGPISVLKKRQIAVIHDLGFLRYPDNYTWLFRTWYRFMYWLASKRVQQLVTVSSFSAREITSQYKLKTLPLRIVPAAGDHAREWEPEEVDLGGNNQAFLLLLGTIATRKNVVPTLETLLQEGHHVVVCGGSGSKRIFSQVSMQGNSNLPSRKFTYFSNPSDNQLAWLFQNCRGFIFPSLYEGFGIPPLEANVWGAEIYASNVTSIPEVLGSTAQYFNPNNLEELTALLRTPVQRLAQVEKYGWTKNTWHESSKLFASSIRDLMDGMS
jgi:glycosyltransferase involved in cell wall biosynthesis